MMKGAVMFASLLVTGESLTYIGSDDPSASVPFWYSGSDLGETADGVGSKVSLVWGSPFTKSGQDLTVDLSDCVNDVQRSVPSSAVRTKTRSTPQWSSPSFAWRFRSSARRAALSARRRALEAGTFPTPLLFVRRVRNWERS